MSSQEDLYEMIMEQQAGLRGPFQMRYEETRAVLETCYPRLAQ